jgi:hypothetical protein
MCQKSTSSAGIKIFNSLLCSVTGLKDQKAQHIAALRRHSNTHRFQFLGEFLICKSDQSIMWYTKRLQHFALY